MVHFKYIALGMKRLIINCSTELDYQLNAEKGAHKLTAYKTEKGILDKTKISHFGR